jgi:hypothetical protein
MSARQFVQSVARDRLDIVLPGANAALEEAKSVGMQSPPWRTGVTMLQAGSDFCFSLLQGAIPARVAD